MIPQSFPHSKKAVCSPLTELLVHAASSQAEKKIVCIFIYVCVCVYVCIHIYSILEYQILTK